jgi:hypothetical protein
MAHEWLTNLAQNSARADGEQRMLPTVWQKRFGEAENGFGPATRRA